MILRYLNYWVRLTCWRMNKPQVDSFEVTVALIRKYPMDPYARDRFKECVLRAWRMKRPRVK